jgi:hypothetical protein
MNNSQISIKKYENIAWGLLAVLWGATILLDFIPFGAGLIGTGLIFLGANAVRWINHLPMRGDNTVLGSLILTWGGLEFARPLLRLMFPLADLDWVIFALLLMGFGIILLVQAMIRDWNPNLGNFAGAHKEQ